MKARAIATGIVTLLTAMTMRGDDLLWLSRDYDFGTIREASGKATGMVKFVNRGKKPTAIIAVRTSCGCTDADHTEGIIAPGDTAFVSFTYNPEGRPGRFEKTVRVYTGEHRDLATITIRGTVIGDPKSLDRDYPYHTGNLRVSEKNVNLGDIKYGASRHRFIKLYNQSDEVIRPAAESSDKALQTDFATPEIAPGDIGTLSMYLTTRETEGPGPYGAEIRLYPDKEKHPEQYFTINYKAEIISDTHGMTPEQVANAGRCDISENIVDLGKVRMKKKDVERKFEFHISNGGKSSLNIGRIYSRTEGVEMKRWPQVLEAGKSGKCEGTIRLGELAPGPFRIALEIQSNDPLHPVRIINIVGIKE